VLPDRRNRRRSAADIAGSPRRSHGSSAVSNACAGARFRSVGYCLRDHGSIHRANQTQIRSLRQSAAPVNPQ